MLANQETVDYAAFKDELAKLSNWIAPTGWYRGTHEAFTGWRAGADAARLKRIGSEFERAKANVNLGRKEFEGATAHVPTEGKVNNKTLFGVAAGLGLGGLGFGYYQYKKNKENDQLARNYPQVG
jgi:hypothetical protein